MAGLGEEHPSDDIALLAIAAPAHPT